MNNQKSKFQSFLFSSIKEVIFIVIGILIALYINNIDTNIKANNEALDFISEINSELKIDTANLNSTVKYSDKLLKDYLSILKTKNLDTISTSKLIEIYNSPTMMINISDANYSRLKNSNVQFVEKFEDIFKTINIYYTSFNTYKQSANDLELDLYQLNIKDNYLQNDIEIGLPIEGNSIIQDSIIRRKNIIKYFRSIKGRNNLTMMYARMYRMKEASKMAYQFSSKLVTKTDFILKVNNRKK